MIAGRVILAAAGATGLLGTPAHSKLDLHYEHAYRQVARRFGHRAPGRNIVRSGLPDGRVASVSRIRRSLGVLEGMLHPAPVVPVAPAVVSATPVSAAPVPSTPTPSGGAGGVPACASESGTNYSTGPDNTNPSGATGRYQIMPGTAAGYGCDLSTPAGQDACAQVIYANQGAGAWVGCGG